MRACTEDQCPDAQPIPFRTVEQSKVEGGPKVDNANSAPFRPTLETANFEGDVVRRPICPCVDISTMNRGVLDRQDLLEVAKVQPLVDTSHPIPKAFFTANLALASLVRNGRTKDKWDMGRKHKQRSLLLNDGSDPIYRWIAGFVTGHSWRGISKPKSEQHARRNRDTHRISVL